MPDAYSILPAGDEALLIELATLEQTLALADGLRRAGVPGITDLVPAARTVLVCFDRNLTSGPAVREAVANIDLARGETRQGQSFEIPVVYDGEDLEEVAAFLGWSIEKLVSRHTAARYTVAFTGFAPGFAYMVCDDPELDVPRRKSPRTRIPAGSVALAGKFGGIYPSDSPGGWQLLGTTPLKMWDTTREKAALLSPGDRVRFRSATDADLEAAAAKIVVPVRDVEKGLVVTRADRPALFQDMGRRGYSSQGVSRSGALDRRSMRLANLCVGNPPEAAVLEIAFGGFSIRADRPITVAAAGAPCGLSIKTAAGDKVSAPFQHPFALDAGDELIFGTPAEGVVTYLALRGGFEVDEVLGSASTDTLARLGPKAITAGSILVPAERRANAVQFEVGSRPRLGTVYDTIILDVTPGPRAAWFAPATVDLFLSQEWSVTPDSSRIGMRLAGNVPLVRAVEGELASEGTVPGAIQVPHDGQPVVFLNDHPLTGGYPVIAVVAEHHRDLAGQIPIGAKVRFHAIQSFYPDTEE